MSPLLTTSLALFLAGADVPPAQVQAVTATYQGAVEQVFQQHCADCHGKLPAGLAEPARTTAQKKSNRAHRRMDIDEGFPFTGKWALPRLVTEIRKTVADEDMPPRSYMEKKGLTLSDAERQAIVSWAKGAESLLSGGP